MVTCTEPRLVTSPCDQVVQVATLSPVEQFRQVPGAEAYLRELTLSQLIGVKYHWEFWARPNQLAPEGDWINWVVKAGRGWGKTRVGAELVRKWVKNFNRVNLIGPTAADARDIMIEGESGILSVCPRLERPVYRPAKRKLIWPNGNISLIFTADEPERLRGPMHSKLWADEIAAWRYPEAWDMAMFGLRLGTSPQVIATTTPKPTKFIKGLIKEEGTVLSSGTTYENAANLSSVFTGKVIKKYEGTRLGRQELRAEILEDNPNALWLRDTIDANRVSQAPPMRRVVVGVDPAVTSNEDSNETGIVVGGIGEDGDVYVMDDRTAGDKPSPERWARAVCKAHSDYEADHVTAEVNNGGDLVESVLKTEDQNVVVIKVRASRGKYTRAEPVAALYEQGKVHHVGCFGQLEDQMCDWDPTCSKSPDRLDALVWVITDLVFGQGTGLMDYYRFAAKKAKAA